MNARDPSARAVAKNATRSLSRSLPKTASSGAERSNSSHFTTSECGTASMPCARTYGSGMKTTIDKAGRVVIPKRLREELGLRAGQEIEVSVRDGNIEIEPVPTPTRLVRRGKLLVAERDASIPPLTAEHVRDVLESVRR